VDLPKFLPLAALTFVVAALMALGMNALYRHGFYFLVVNAVLAAVLLSMLLRTAVGLGRCRSPLLAAALGLAVGLVFYLGFYYAGMLGFIGWDNARRIDLLPKYIHFRLQTDTHHDPGDSNRALRRPLPVFNWIIFVVEFGFVVCISTLTAYRRASRSYCENCAKWKEQEVLILPPKSGAKVVDWMSRGELASIARVPPYTPSNKASYTAVALEGCAGGAAAACASYLAAKDVARYSPGTNFRKFDGARGQLRLARTQLTPAEMDAIRPAFPRLLSQAARKTNDPPVKGNVQTSAGRNPPRKTGSIQIESLPPDDAGKIMNKWAILIGNLIGLLTLVIFLGAIVGLFFAWHRAWDTEGNNPIQLGEMIGLGIVCAVVAGLSGYISQVSASVWGNCFYRARARHFIAQRRNKIVDPHRATDSPIFFVEVVPKQNWHRLMAETATDIGFLQVDHRQGELRFEGSQQRYRIPASAIERCEIELHQSSGNARTVYHMVVISGQTADGPWEIPFCARYTNFILPTNHRARDGQAILAEILPLIGSQAPAGAEAQIAPEIPLAGPSRARIFWQKSRWRLVFLVILVALAAFNRFHKPHPRQFAQTELRSLEPGVRMLVSNIQTGQKVSSTLPYVVPGGDWTVFDCVPEADPTARMTVAVEAPAAKLSDVMPISFARAVILPGDAGAGARFVAAMAKGLGQSIPPPRSPQPLKPVEFNTAVLGQNLSSPEMGFKTDGGSWVASKWFVQNDGSEAEVYFNYDLVGGQAEFSEKDASFDSDALVGIAAAVRDGPRPPRTPQNDPTFTLDGPKVVGLIDIPDSAKCSAEFGPDCQMVVLIRHGPPAEVFGVSPADPQKRISLANLDGACQQVILADPQGEHLIIVTRDAADALTFVPNATTHLWWIDRPGGKQTELTGPWGDHGLIRGSGEAISPDGQYLAVEHVEGTLLDQHQAVRTYLLNLQSRQAVPLATADLFIKRWTGSGSMLRAVLGGPMDDFGASRDIAVADPVTGAVLPLDASAAKIPETGMSPDGKWKIVLHEHQSVDIMEPASGKVRTFVFNEADRQYAEEGNLVWLTSRYIEFDTTQRCFIDVNSMKLGYLPASPDSGQTVFYKFSPDFKWAVVRSEQGIALGRVAIPD
jgi:hypothetical protein